MHNARLVHCLQPLAELLDKVIQIPPGERTLALQPCFERFTVQQFHGQETQIAVRGAIEYAADLGMGGGARGEKLLLGGDCLERERNFEIEIVRLINAATHSTLPNQLANAVPAAQDPARLQPL